MGEVKGVDSLVVQLIKRRSPDKSVVEKKDKVTNMLIRATHLAAARDAEYKNIVQQLKERHEQVVDELLNSKGFENDASDPAVALRAELLSALYADFEDFNHLLRAVWLSKSAYDANHAHWYGYGEIWSARLMQAYLTLLDANTLLLPLPLRNNNK